MRMLIAILALCLSGCSDAHGNGSAHYLVLGQSNAGSHAERRTTTTTGRVFAEYLGQTVLYADPVRGATTWEWGEGSIWGLVGDALVNAGRFDTVTFTNISIGGSTVACWSRVADHAAWGAEKPCYDRIDDVFASGINPTGIIWMQGESDRGHSPLAYETDLLDVIAHIHEHTSAPIYIGTTTLCGDAGGDDLIREVQQRVGIQQRIGADTDIAAPLQDRRFHADHCHLSWSGQQKAAMAWFEVLRQ